MLDSHITKHNLIWLLFAISERLNEIHQSCSCNVRIVFKHRRERREWAWRHSAMFAEKTQYMFLILCGQRIKRRWFLWARKNHYSTQNYKIQGCKILFITNSIWRRSRWEVPEKKLKFCSLNDILWWTPFFGRNLFWIIGFLCQNYHWCKINQRLAWILSLVWMRCQWENS